MSLAGAKALPPRKCCKGWQEHRNAAGRRAWVMREDERREESRVYWLENVRKRGGFQFQLQLAG